MYRRPKFLEVLHQIREEMSCEANYDIHEFAKIILSEKKINAQFENQSTNLGIKNKQDVVKTPKVGAKNS